MENKANQKANKSRLVFFRRVQPALNLGSRLFLLAVLGLAVAFGTQGLPPALSQQPSLPWLPVAQHLPAAEPAQLVEEGRTLYRQGRFSEAAEVWKRAAQMYGAGDVFARAMALSYLSLAEQQEGKWREAGEAIGESVKLLEAERGKSLSAEQLQIFAQVFNTRGRLQLAQGESEAALASWTEAGDIYKDAGDEVGVTGNSLNQAQALQSLGRYRQALKLLVEVQQRLKKQPDPLLEATQLRIVSNVLRAVGDLDTAQTVLEKLNGDGQLQSPQEKSATLLSLGNTERDLGNRERTLKEISSVQTPFGCAVKPSQSQVDLQHYRDSADYYRQAAELNSPATRLQANLNLLSMQVMLANIDSGPARQEEQRSAARQLWPEISSELQEWPASPAAAHARVNLAQSLACLNYSLSAEAVSWSDIDRLVESAVQISKSIKDERAEAYALGKRGGLYEMTGDWERAEKFTELALKQAQSIQAWDIAYQWEWQLGRLRKAQGMNEDARAAYSAAVTTIESLRKNLAGIDFGLRVSDAGELLAVSTVQDGTSDTKATDRSSVQHPLPLDTDIQFEFRTKVEPVYRELVELLLQPSAGETQPPQKNLERARDLILHLQDAELQSLLLCDLQRDLKRVPVFQVIAEKKLEGTAVIYPFIMPGQPDYRIGFILEMGKNKPLLYSGNKIGQPEEFLRTLAELRSNLRRSGDTRFEVNEYSEKLYDWLIRPITAPLESNHVKTLIFVLDSSLRNIPMAALHNRDTQEDQSYLVQKYAVAISTGWLYSDPKPLPEVDLNPLAAGLNDPKDKQFPKLVNAEQEAIDIGKLLKNTKVITGDAFTRTAIEKEVSSSPYNLVHMATHGQFSSTPKETFILTARDPRRKTQQLNNRVGVNELAGLLRNREVTAPDPIELLVLSACETASGDNRAALGLAGVAIRAGASSTIASLWTVNDKSAYEFMTALYKKLSERKVSRAEALQQVQNDFLNQYSGKYKHPGYWAAYVLVGNWL